MKTKTTLLSLLMAGFAHSATLISTLTSPKITSTVTLDNGVYNYKYVINARPLDDQNDLLNLSINMCDSAFTSRYYGDDPFNLLKSKDYVKFNDIDVKGDNFIFGYESTNAPTKTDILIKTCGSNYTDKILTPDCKTPCIPETSAWMMSLLTLPLIFKRRNK
jgi:hypothetical protein